MHLGRLDESEAIARQCLAKTDESFWPIRFTLAEVLSRKGKRDEVQALVLSIMKNAPTEVQRHVRDKQQSGEILK